MRIINFIIIVQNMIMTLALDFELLRLENQYITKSKMITYYRKLRILFADYKFLINLKI